MDTVRGHVAYQLWYCLTLTAKGDVYRSIDHSADYAVARCPSVRLSVCLSVTRRYSIETAKRILKLLSPSGSHTILVSPHQTVPILIFKIFICRRGMVQESCWMHLPTRVGNLEVSIVCWRESIRRVQLPSTRQRQTAFGAERWRILCSVRSTSEKRIDQLVRFHMKLAFPG